MTIYITGGSNSVRRGGWVSNFNPDAVNLSVGASTSIMSVYRTMFTIDIQAGDTVIWEYALNDANQALGRGRAYTPDFLLRYCEALIRHCASRGARFIPIIFTPQHREQVVKIDVYRHKLTQLLRHYNLPRIDISRELRRRLGVETLPDEYYFDKFHYHPDSRPVLRAARRAERLLAADFEPVDPNIPPLLVEPDFDIGFFTDFDGAVAGEFSNSLLKVPVFGPENIPLHLKPRDRAGRIVGVFVISPPDAGVLELAIDNADGTRVDTFDLSIAHNEPNHPKPVFKMFSLVNARPDPVTFDVGQSITLSAATGAGLALTDVGFAESPDATHHGCKASVAGVLVELSG